MSFYSFLKGIVQYKDKESFDNIVNKLTEEGYLIDGKFVDEVGEFISAKKNIDEKKLEINIPLCYYRNLSRFDFKPGAKDLYIKGASFDGCFEGWIDTAKVSSSVDLEKYAETELNMPAPEKEEFDQENDYFDALYEWQDSVISNFMRD